MEQLSENKNTKDINYTSILTVPFDEKGFAVGWRFAVHRASSSTIGVSRMKYVVKSERLWNDDTPVGERKNKNTIIELDVQTRNYNPTKGEVFYDKPIIDEIWKDALEMISFRVDVVDVTSDTVTFSVSEINESKTGLTFVSTFKANSEFFALFLQTGMLISLDGEVSYPCDKSRSKPILSIQTSDVPIPSSLTKLSNVELSKLLKKYIHTQIMDDATLIDVVRKNISIKQYNNFKSENK